MVVVGGMMLGWSLLPVVPSCNGAMGRNDTCRIVTSRGSETLTYDEMRERQDGQQTASRYFGIVLLIGGLGSLLSGPIVKRWHAARWREAQRGPDNSVTSRATEAVLGGYRRSAPVSGDRIAHLYEAGVVVTLRQTVKTVVAWRDVEVVYEDRASDLVTGETWVSSCGLVTGGTRVDLVDDADDRQTLGAVVESVTAARGPERVAEIQRRLDAGETVVFGPLHLDARGVTRDKVGELAWGEIKGAVVRVELLEKHRTSTAYVEIDPTPQAHLLLALRGRLSDIPDARSLITVVQTRAARHTPNPA